MPRLMERFPCTFIYEVAPGVYEELWAYSFRLSFLRPLSLLECYMTAPEEPSLPWLLVLDMPMTCCLEAHEAELWLALGPAMTGLAFAVLSVAPFVTPP